MRRFKHEVWYNDKKITTLNKKLIKDKKLNDATVSQIKQMHIFKHIICKRAKLLDNGQIARAKELAVVYELIEYELQRLWGFEEDSKFHRFWEFPKCSCPVLDNEDRLGTNQKVHIQSCIVHGYIVEDLAEQK